MARPAARRPGFFFSPRSPYDLPVIPLAQVIAAHELARPFVRRTPLLELDGGPWLKLELLQPTGSFKVRGFFAAALALPETARARGLLTVSAGNAALACAHVANRLGVPCRVVMFDSAPAPKVDGVRGLGGTPVLLPRAEPLVLDWPGTGGRPSRRRSSTVRGPGPAGRARRRRAGDRLTDLPEVERLVVAVGGGGLVAGSAAPFASSTGSVEIVGVQSDGYPLWPRTFAEGSPPALTPATIADGTSAPYDAPHARAARRVRGLAG